MKGRATVAATFLLCIACGDSPTEPTRPQSPPGQPPTNIRLTVTVDSSASRDAIAALSEVTADASASTGAGLTFTTDFGDGTRVTGAVTRHIYHAPGTYTITCESRDAQGRSASASHQIEVRTLTGAWFHASHVAPRKRVQVRRLSITGQEGTRISGTYQVTGDADRSFTGTLASPRTARLVISPAVTLEGVIPSHLNAEGEFWTLAARGDSVDGQHLAFRPIVGGPSTAPPDAVFDVRFNSYEDENPILGLSPITFDGSRSRGEGLLHFIEFGDGEVTTESRTRHVINEPEGQFIVSRLTVVDKFGRHDEESRTFRPFQLHDSPGDQFWFPRSGDGPLFLSFEFRTRTGPTTYPGTVFHGFSTSFHGFPAECVATLHGERDIRIVVPSAGIEFRGYLVVVPFATRMFLTQHGGANDGRSWVLLYDSY